ncbi:MAG: hypothetical protein QNJ40_15720 [Xanthomonadales bacterium]|nr:hypothetical protein [Xanthomonadales bacterium]
MRKFGSLCRGLGLLVGLFTSQALFAQLVEDFESVAPGQLVNSFPAQGISLGNSLLGVRCDVDPGVREGSNCLSARSGNTAVRTLGDSEFTRDPFRFNFAALQDEVRAYVRLDAPASFDGTEMRVSIGAVDESGVIFKSRFITFTHDFDGGQWHELVITENIPLPPLVSGQKIAGVVIWGQQNDGSLPTADEAVNDLLLDDLVFDRTGELPEDTVAPEIVEFSVPANTFLPSASPDVRVEEMGPVAVARLDTVRIRVEHETDVLVSDFSENPLCGSPAGPCPALEFQASDNLSIALDPELAGLFELTLQACDVSANCSEATVFVRYLPPSELPEVRSWWMEINQGLQTLSGVVQPAQLGIASYPTAAGPFIPNRDTLVRYYLVATDEPRSNYTERLYVKVWREDGSVRSYSLDPNAVPETVQVMVDPGDTPGRQQLAWSHRPDVNATLNFVIPSEWLADADMFSVRLGQFNSQGEPVTGEMQVSLAAPTTLGLVPVLLNSRRFVTPATADVVQQSKILRSSFPVSGDILYPNPTLGRWSSRSDTINPHFAREIDYPDRRSVDCGKVLSWTRSVFAGDLATYRSTLADTPNVTLVAGLLGDGLEGCAGMAYRPGEVSVSEIKADRGLTVDHEIMHNLGSRHASDNHGESNGGSFEPWPYPHGHMSPDGISNFGVLMDQVGFESLSGQWNVFIIDPCRVTPLGDLAQRIPTCALPADNRVDMHDFMSYAPIPTWTQGIPSGSKTFAWMSDITWDRAWQAMRDGARAKQRGPSVKTPGSDPVALIVAGTIEPDGNILTLERLLRQTLPQDALTQAAGDYFLRVYDQADTLLVEHAFIAEVLDDGNQHFWVAIADQPAADRVEVIAPGDEVLGSTAGSANPPTVNLVSPMAGLVGPGPILISWEASDPDGDELSFLVQISPDNGASWLGLALTEPGDATSVTVPAAGLIPTDTARVRVIASDGFHTATDESAQPFTLRVPGHLFANGFEG